MILPKRLKILIRNRAKIYYINMNVLNIFQVKLQKGDFVNNFTFCSKEIQTQIKYLFETKEEAEHYFNFGEIQKHHAEILSLPPFEEVISSKTLIYFNNYVLNINKKQISLIDLKDVVAIFSKKSSKENYSEACLLCKKLYLKVV